VAEIIPELNRFACVVAEGEIGRYLRIKTLFDANIFQPRRPLFICAEAQVASNMAVSKMPAARIDFLFLPLTAFYPYCRLRPF
jgi:hypothetical protein